MLMMFQQLVQVCQVMVIISFSSSITSLASLLPPGEVAALREISKTLNENGQVSWILGDRCESEKVKILSASPNEKMNFTIGCSCSIADDKFCHITSFELRDYDLLGRLPPDLANLTYVEKIDFTRNYLYDTIPVEWASMKNLSFISLASNRLSGNIPGYFGNFTGLTFLSLESNQFSGVVPPELGKLSSLETLILSSNKLVGTLPEALAQIKNLTDFRVSDNNLNGTVPEFIGSWTQLQKLGLCATGLQGPIPRAIFLLENLTDLRISDTPGPEFPLPKVPNKMKYLVLRNINLNGTIPSEAWNVERTLDLTFNKLVGELPSTTIRRQFTFLSGNLLTGTVPESFIQSNQSLDVSYNNFTWSPGCSYQMNKNWFRSSSSNNNLSDLLPCQEISRCPKYYRSFYINCGGGQDVKNGTILYEGEANIKGSAAARNYHRPGSNWGFSSTGDFMDDNYFNDDKYTLRSNADISPVVSELYTTARRTPLSITYYGYCLENGDYTVRLHFAEIQFTDEIPGYQVTRRVFDIYIQGKRVKQDFNIKEAAKGSNRDITIPFNTTVINSTLEIRLYWAGKGSTVMPRSGDYGAIISAISVCSGNRTYCEEPISEPISEPEEASKKPIVIGVVTSAVFLIFLGMGVSYWKFCYGHKHTRERDEEKNHRSFFQEQRKPRGSTLAEGNKGSSDELPRMMDLSAIRAATDNFSVSNKLGQGGFGPVYKGILSDGSEVAVKRLSRSSEQGVQELKNEVRLIMKLQHKNLVRLLGFCVEGEEKLLVYEFMPNSSLDVFLFDPTKRPELYWSRRIDIINGIAKGMLYLHEDSRLKIVHRDLKASNILLDNEMNPKISDFGMARIFSSHEDEANTARIVGTYGYMAPEYAMEGLYSTKSDVFSFGVLLLEIISGRKKAGYHLPRCAPSLLACAWQLWNEGNKAELIDPMLSDSCNAEEFSRYMHIGLLCVQEDASDRPTMSSVVLMLKSHNSFLPQPERPAFVGRFMDNLKATASNFSVNEMTLSDVVPR